LNNSSHIVSENALLSFLLDRIITQQGYKIGYKFCFSLHRIKFLKNPAKKREKPAGFDLFVSISKKGGRYLCNIFFTI